MENQNTPTVTAFLKSGWIEEIKDYPFGRHRTTGQAWLEFDVRHGFRFCRQLVDPKNGRICKPKKSTYSEIALPVYNSLGHFTYHTFRFASSVEAMQSEAARIAENWELWSQGQKNYILIICMMHLKASVTVLYQYSGLNPQNGIELGQVLSIFEATVERIKAGLKNEISNPLENLPVNLELYRELMAKVPQGYSPFTTKVYNVDYGTGKLVPVETSEENQ